MALAYAASREGRGRGFCAPSPASSSHPSRLLRGRRNSFLLLPRPTSSSVSDKCLQLRATQAQGNNRPKRRAAEGVASCFGVP